MNKAGVKGLPSGEAASSFPEVAFNGPNSVTGQCNAMGSRIFSNTTNLFGGRDFTNEADRSAVASVLVGARSAAEVRDCAEQFATPPPAAFWQELRQERLLPSEAPVPAEEES